MSYINYNQKAYNSLPAKQKENAIESFQYFFYLLRGVLKDNKFEYKIYTSKNVDQKLLEQYKIIYPYREKIYYAVLIPDKTLFCFFILDDNNKIISFIREGFMSLGKEIKPFLLTSEAQTKLPSAKAEGFGFRLKPTKVTRYTVVNSSSPLSSLS